MARRASGNTLRRIQKAFNEWRWRGDAVRWDDKDHIRDFLALLERTGLTQREIMQRLQEHTNSGEAIKEQDNPPGHDYDTDVWFGINLPVDKRELFIKFALIEDEDEYPSILIVNIHW